MDKLTYIKQAVQVLINKQAYEQAQKTIERHAPELTEWLMSLLPVWYTNPKPIFTPIQIVAEDKTVPVECDVELARLAMLLGQFALYRIWVYTQRRIGDGSGHIQRNELRRALLEVGISYSRRHFNRLLHQGEDLFWTIDNSTQFIYLTGVVRLAERLSKQILQTVHARTLNTNKPGQRRMQVNLGGSIEDAKAQIYATWFIQKDRNGAGVQISRQTLTSLWGVSVPTLQDWERRANIRVSRNYAQQQEISLAHHDGVFEVPHHAYLCLDIKGRDFVSWQLANSYQVTSKVCEASHIGKSRKVRQIIQREIAITEQPGFIRDAGLRRSGRLYFSDEAVPASENFKALDKHLRKHGDVFRPHYAALGRKHHIRIYERSTGQNSTYLEQRDYKGERTLAFRERRQLYCFVLQDMHRYAEGKIY